MQHQSRLGLCIILFSSINDSIFLSIAIISCRRVTVQCIIVTYRIIQTMRYQVVYFPLLLPSMTTYFLRSRRVSNKVVRTYRSYSLLVSSYHEYRKNMYKIIFHKIIYKIKCFCYLPTLFFSALNMK